MKKDYSDLLRLLLLLKARVFIVESKYSDLNLDEINVYELDKDIDTIEGLIGAISFKKDKIVDKMMEKYFQEYYEQLEGLEHEMVVE